MQNSWRRQASLPVHPTARCGLTTTARKPKQDCIGSLSRQRPKPWPAIRTGWAKTMFRIAKLTDYAVVLTTTLSTAPWERVQSVAVLCDRTQIPAPTVSKVLKRLARAGVVQAVRGAHGGYRLAAAPSTVAIRRIIEAMEGPVAITDCSVVDAEERCAHQGQCRTEANWQRINSAIQAALDAVTLADMAEVHAPQLVPLRRQQPRAGGSAIRSPRRSETGRAASLAPVQARRDGAAQAPHAPEPHAPEPPASHEG